MTSLPKSPRTEPCELCGQGEFLRLSERDRRGQALQTVVCRGCGLVSHETIPSDAEVSAYYAKEYRRDYKGEAAPSARRVARAWEQGQIILRHLRPYLRPGDHVLDIGSGVGCVVKAFQLAGFPASGIEPNEGYEEFSRRVLLAPVRCAELSDMPRQAMCDVVVLSHVIEHLNSPGAALAHIRELLRPGGRLYIECPNIAAPHAAPGAQFHYAHIYNFTPWTLQPLAEAAGFRLLGELTAPNDVNLRQVFVRADKPRRTIDPEGCSRTLAAACRYSALTYHLRPTYLARRGAQMADRIVERFTAQRRLERIIAECARHDGQARTSSRAA